MFGGNYGYGQGNAPNPYYQSIQGLATTLAIVATLLGGPALAGWSEDFVVDLIRAQYGYGFTHIGVIVWHILCWFIVFFMSRAFLFVALMTLAVGAIQYLPAFA